MSLDVQHIRVLDLPSNSSLDDRSWKTSRHAGQIIVAAFIQSQHFRPLPRGAQVEQMILGGRRPNNPAA